MYLYSNTPIRNVNHHLTFIEIKSIQDRTIVAQVPKKFIRHLNEDEIHTNGTITLNHAREQFPFRESTSREENAQYCIGRIHMIRAHLPVWEVLGTVWVDYQDHRIQKSRDLTGARLI